MIEMERIPVGDPLHAAWAEESSPDSWGVPAVYEHGMIRVVAAELERIAVHFDRQAEYERERLRRLEKSGAKTWRIESAMASAQECAGFAKHLRARVKVLTATQAGGAQ